MPQGCVGNTFEYLYNTLLKRKLICMALYRLKGVTDNNQPYVYTNPQWDTVINHKDRAFVLGIEIPDDLQGDHNEMIEKDKGIELDNFNGSHSDSANQRGRAPNPQSAKERQEDLNHGHDFTPQDNLQRNEPLQDGGDEDEQPFGLAAKNQGQSIQKVTKKLHDSVLQIEDAVNKIEKKINTQNNHILSTTKDITKEYLNSYKEDFQARMSSGF